ncbi:MAG: hypothetical protein IIY73_00865 [Solobacterium sp.]|nr:hypothetical protein [Solobacterium sp.]
MKAYEICKDDPAAAAALVNAGGETYRSVKTQTQIYEEMGTIDRNRQDYEDKMEFLKKMEKGLSYCSPDAQIILRNEVLRKPEPKWYRRYYTTTTYYRHRHTAYLEFLRCLDI